MLTNYRSVRALPLSLLVLLVVACSKKKEPEPAPKLEGTWRVHHSETVSYNANGSVFSRTGQIMPSIPITYAYTPSQFTVTINNRPTVYDYTRNNQTLSCRLAASTDPPYQDQIEELTATTLVLKNTVVRPPNGDYNVTTIYLGR